MLPKESPTSVVLSHAVLARQNQDGESFAEALILNPEEPTFLPLQNDLLDNDVDIRLEVQTFFPDREDKPFLDLFSELLQYVTQVHSNEWNDGSEDVPPAVIEFNSLLPVYSHATRVFQLRQTGWFVPALLKMTSYLVFLAECADRVSISRSKQKKCTEATTRVMIPPFGLAAADRGIDLVDKRDATFFLANLLFKLYYDLDNIRLCDTILKNLEKQLPRLHEFPRADQTMFHFWRGRIFLTQQRIRQAHEELKMAFEICTNENFVNKRIILIYLVATSLPLGIFPNIALLEYFNIAAQFGRMIRAVKLGDMFSYREALFRWRGWLAKRGLWLLLKEKGEVLVWRSLIRRSVLFERARIPTLFSLDVKQPPTLNFSNILVALRYSSRDQSYTVIDVESMCCSLLDQGYIKGYILHSRLALVLQKSEQLGFPPPSSIIVDSTVDGEEE